MEDGTPSTYHTVLDWNLKYEYDERYIPTPIPSYIHTHTQISRRVCPGVSPECQNVVLL